MVRPQAIESSPKSPLHWQLYLSNATFQIGGPEGASLHRGHRSVKAPCCFESWYRCTMFGLREKVCMSSVERHADHSRHGPIRLCGEGKNSCLLEQVRHSPLSRPMAAFDWWYFTPIAEARGMFILITMRGLQRCLSRSCI